MSGLSKKQIITKAIMAPWDDSDALRDKIASLRSQGEVVIESLPGHEHNESTMVCDRVIAYVDQSWQVVKK